MSTGPSNYGSGYLFESQKSISDRRAAAGFPPGARDAGQGSGSAGGGDIPDGGGSLITTLLLGALFLMWKIVKVAAPSPVADATSRKLRPFRARVART